jgi:molecular chaperone GrpE (heat shock protein)
MNLSKIAVKVVSRNLASKQFKFTNTVLSQPKRFFTISTFRWNEKVEEEEEKEKKPENDLETKLQEQEKKFKELQQKYLLSLSDQENTRMIAKKDVESARKFALQNFALSLLEVPDTLNLALNSVPKEKQEEDGMKTFVQGM